MKNPNRDNSRNLDPRPEDTDAERLADFREVLFSEIELRKNGFGMIAEIHLEETENGDSIPFSKRLALYLSDVRSHY